MKTFIKLHGFVDNAVYYIRIEDVISFYWDSEEKAVAIDYGLGDQVLLVKESLDEICEVLDYFV